MPMTDFSLKIPQALLAYIQTENPQDELVRNAMLVYPLIKNNKISHGRAAELLGIPKMQLIELYGELGIPYIDIGVEEVKKEVATYERLFGAA